MVLKVTSKKIVTKRMRSDGNIVENLNHIEVQLKKPILNLRGMILKAWNFPNTNPTFTTLNNTLRIYESVGDHYGDISLGTDGNYSDLSSIFSTKSYATTITNDANSVYYVAYDSNTTKVTITSNNGANFALDFSYGTKGWHNATLLGFNPKMYSGTNTYTGEFSAQAQPNSYTIKLEQESGLSLIKLDTTINADYESGSLYTMANDKNYTEYITGSNNFDDAKPDKMRPVNAGVAGELRTFIIKIYDDTGNLATISGDYELLIGFIYQEYIY